MYVTNSSLYQVRPLSVNLPGDLIMLFEKCQHFPVEEEKRLLTEKQVATKADLFTDSETK